MKKTRAFLCKFIRFSDFTYYNARAINGVIFLDSFFLMGSIVRMRCFLPQNLLQELFPSLFERKTR